VSDDVLGGAEARRVAIIQRLKALADEKGQLENELSQVNLFIEQAKAYAAGRAPAVTAPRGRNSRAEVMAVILRVLGEAGRPMQLSEIYGAVQEAGLVLSGKDPSGAMSTILWRGGQEGTLVNLKGAGYWDASKPYPPAKYEPSRK
jgi:hypothetical protein